MKLINATPHPINIVDADGQEVYTIPASGILVRCAANTEPDVSIEIDGVEIPTSRTVFGEITGLPEEADGVFYIVSQLVKSAAANRKDLLVPAEVLRDEGGKILGCRSLGR